MVIKPDSAQGSDNPGGNLLGSHGILGGKHQPDETTSELEVDFAPHPDETKKAVVHYNGKWCLR